MPISINIIACLECSCHIWVLQLVYFDKIHHVWYAKKKKSNVLSHSFRGVGHKDLVNSLIQQRFMDFCFFGFFSLVCVQPSPQEAGCDIQGV
jgi:hypothetical protein